MKRGEIRWYKFDRPDKQRPVLVLSRSSIIPFLGEVTVAPVTTTIRDIPSEVALSSYEGMPKECAVNCDHLQTVSKDKIGSVIAVLPANRMREVAAAVAFALALDE